MKLRYLLFTLLALTLTACNFSLAEDITPPPNYVSPTPMPTLGPLYPAEAPSLERGAAIYAEKCVDCHGPKGMGDGDQGKQLPVTVAALALPEFARPASPVDWYTVVTRGNIQSFMPPFVSLNEQQRWDVVAYVLSLHASPEEVARGRQLFETNCAGCPLDVFKNQEKMASLSEDEIVGLLKNGGENVTPLSGNLTDEDYYAVASYLRTLTFAVALPTPTPEPATPTPTAALTELSPTAVGTESLTPGVEATPTVEGAPATVASATPVGTEATPAVDANGTPLATVPPAVDANGTPLPAATPVSGIKFTGSVSGANVAGSTATLRGYDHASDSTGATEVVTRELVLDATGQYTFDGLERVENRIFVVDIAYQGVTYSSELIVPAADQSEIAVAPITLYETTEDYSTLVFEQAHFFIDMADVSMQVIGVYTFSNTSDKTIIIRATIDVPFLKAPANAQNVSYDITKESAPLLQAEGGFAIPPSDKPYGIVVLYTMPYNGNLELSQPLVLPASSVLVLAPEGVKVKTSQLTRGDTQSFNNGSYISYQGKDFKAGDTITLQLSGNPKGSSSAASGNSRQGLLIGVGALGVALISAGAWLYLRDRRRFAEEEGEEEEDAMESEEDILDAIIALDDLHRTGKINDEAYQARRAELKSRLKDML